MTIFQQPNQQPPAKALAHTNLLILVLLSNRLDGNTGALLATTAPIAR